MTHTIARPAALPDLSDVVPASQIADEVDAWLRVHACADAAVQWTPRGGPTVPTRNGEHLSALVALLGTPGEWGVVRRGFGSQWGQTMRVDGGWIIEVNGEPGPDCFARRVAMRESAESSLTPCVTSAGRTTATYQRREVVPSAASVGGILWSWLRGSLPAGFELRSLEEHRD